MNFPVELTGTVNSLFMADFSQFVTDPDDEGNELKYTVSGLPALSGLSLHPTTGVLTGVLFSFFIT